VTYNPESLPATDAVIAVLKGTYNFEGPQGVVFADAFAREVGALLAHCFVRDEEVRRERVATDDTRVLNLAAPIHDWIPRGLSVRTANCLINADWYCVADVWGKTDAELLRAKNFGRKCLTEINDVRRRIGPATEADVRAALEQRPTKDEAWAAYRANVLGGGR
jgi:hypothetical protein